MKASVKKLKNVDMEIVDIYWKKFLSFHKKTDNYRLNKKLSAAKKTELLKLYFYSNENLNEMRNQGLI